MLWKEEDDIDSLPWPANSPDMNPIKHVWDMLKKAIWRRIPAPSNLDELRITIEEKWSKLSPIAVKMLVRSMPDRIQALKKAKRRNTCYWMCSDLILLCFVIDICLFILLQMKIIPPFCPWVK